MPGLRLNAPPLTSTRDRSRDHRYLPLERDFAARVVLFHEAVAARLGLNPTDVRVLRLLGVQPLTAGALARQVGLTGAAMTTLIDRLEVAGYATRLRDQADRRKVTVRAIPEKLAAFDRLYADFSAEMLALLGKYDEAGLTAILDYLGEATKVLAAQVEKMGQV